MAWEENVWVEFYWNPNLDRCS